MLLQIGLELGTGLEIELKGKLVLEVKGKLEDVPKLWLNGDGFGKGNVLVANGCFAVTVFDNVSLATCVVLPIELSPTDDNPVELLAAEAATAVVAATETSAPVSGL